MNRARVMLALIPVNAVVFVIADNGWTRIAAACGALTCLFLYLSTRSAKAEKPAAPSAPVRRAQVRRLMKTGMDRSEALDRDLDETDPAAWERLVAADRAAWRNATPAERRYAADALDRHDYR